MSYAKANWSAFVQERYIGQSVFLATNVQGIDTSDNTVPAIWYTDVSASYRFGWTGERQELFVAVNNVFNRDAPIALANPTTFSIPTSIAYDRIGRYFTAGLRLRF